VTNADWGKIVRQMDCEKQAKSLQGEYQTVSKPDGNTRPAGNRPLHHVAAT